MNPNNFYDSMSEESFAAQVKSFYGYTKTDRIFNTSCEDIAGTPFNWQPDFLSLSETMPMIEYKCASLNSRKEKIKADNALSSALIAGYKRQGLCISQFAWSNSICKHSIVSASLPPLNYLIVFQNPPTPKDAARYLKKNLLWCTASALPSMLAAIHFAKCGYNFQFTQNTKTYKVEWHPMAALANA